MKVVEKTMRDLKDCQTCETQKNNLVIWVIFALTLEHVKKAPWISSLKSKSGDSSWVFESNRVMRSERGEGHWSERGDGHWKLE